MAGQHSIVLSLVIMAVVFAVLGSAEQYKYFVISLGLLLIAAVYTWLVTRRMR